MIKQDLSEIHDPGEKPTDSKMKLLFIKGLGTSTSQIIGWWDDTFNKWYRRDKITEVKNIKGWSYLNEWPKQQVKD